MRNQSHIGPRFLLATGTILATLAVPISHLSFLGIIALFLLVCHFFLRVSAWSTLKAFALLSPMIFFLSVFSLFRENGTLEFLLQFSRSALCLFTILIFLRPLPPLALPLFLKRLRIPEPLPTIMALTLRYFGILQNETNRMKRARTSRLFNTNASRPWGSLASLAARLFSRTLRRADRIYLAMTARGWK